MVNKYKGRIDKLEGAYPPEKKKEIFISVFYTQHEDLHDSKIRAQNFDLEYSEKDEQWLLREDYITETDHELMHYIDFIVQDRKGPLKVTRGDGTEIKPKFRLV